MGPRFNEVKGDALFALGQYEEAESAYLAALAGRWRHSWSMPT